MLRKTLYIRFWVYLTVIIEGKMWTTNKHKEQACVTCLRQSNMSSLRSVTTSATIQPSSGWRVTTDNTGSKTWGRLFYKVQLPRIYDATQYFNTMWTFFFLQKNHLHCLWNPTSDFTKLWILFNMSRELIWGTNIDLYLWGRIRLKVDKYLSMSRLSKSERLDRFKNFQINCSSQNDRAF